MTLVLVDALALVDVPAEPDRGLRLRPDAATALAHLDAAGCGIALVGEPTLAAGILESLGAPVADIHNELPPDAAGWLVTGDAASCARARAHRGLRTVLVGSANPARGAAGRLADVEARDLVDAAITILAAEAMPEPAGRAPSPTRRPRIL